MPFVEDCQRNFAGTFPDCGRAATLFDVARSTWADYPHRRASATEKRARAGGYQVLGMIKILRPGLLERG